MLADATPVSFAKVSGIVLVESPPALTHAASPNLKPKPELNRTYAEPGDLEPQAAYIPRRHNPKFNFTAVGGGSKMVASFREAKVSKECRDLASKTRVMVCNLVMLTF